MTITLLAPDGVPITAQQFRQANAATYGGGAGRPLGGRSGFRVDTPSGVFTATSTTWTLGPCAAEIDAGASTTQGMYGWASDANLTGSVTAADSTNARIDIVYIQVNDSSAGDGSGAKNANVGYLAGTPSTTPTAPALPARSFLVGTISVPKAGGGAPTATLNTARFAAAGAPLPIYSATERAGLTPYVGMEIRRLDLTQIDGSGTAERWNGSAWDHFGRAEFTTQANGIPAGSTANLGSFATVTGKTTDSNFVTIVAGGGIRPDQSGTYVIDVVQKMSAGANGRAFISLEDAAGGSPNMPFGRVNFSGSEDTTSISVELGLAAGQTVYPKLYQSTGVVNISGVVRVKRVP